MAKQQEAYDEQQASAQDAQQASDMQSMQAQIDAMQAQQAQQAAPAPAPVAAAPAAAPAGDDMMAQLQQLATMKNSGILSDAEFEAAKAKLLGM